MFSPIFHFLTNSLTHCGTVLWLSDWLFFLCVCVILSRECLCSGEKMVKKPHCWTSVVNHSLGVLVNCWSHKGSMFPGHCHQAQLTVYAEELSGCQILFHMSIYSSTLISFVHHFLFQFKWLHHFIVLAYVVSTQQGQPMPLTNTFFFLQNSHTGILQCMAL